MNGADRQLGLVTDNLKQRQPCYLTWVLTEIGDGGHGLQLLYCTEGLESLSSFSQFVSILHMSTGHCDGLTADDAYALNTVL